MAPKKVFGLFLTVIVTMFLSVVLVEPFPVMKHVTTRQGFPMAEALPAFKRDRVAGSWEFHVVNYTATTRAPGHLGNLTIDFYALDMFSGNSSAAHCNLTIPVPARQANDSYTGYPSKSAGVVPCVDPDWIFYYGEYNGADDFALNLEHVSRKTSAGSFPAIYYGTGPRVDGCSDPSTHEYCTGSGYCDYWLNSTLVVPITAATA